MQLNGNSLGKRQQDLNLKVNKAAADNVPFETIKDQPEQSDVDRLFKIDLASKYRNIQYLIETLKSGDTLYISKALKCVWMYEDKYSEVINSDYLQQNVFPFMSIKMKKKFLTTIYMYVRNESRAKDWFEYCMNTDLTHFACKFLLFTSQQNKIDVLKNNFEKLDLDFLSDIKCFIGNDITLAELYLEKTFRTVFALRYLGYFYTIDENLYLNWIEKYCDPESIFYIKKTFLGSRVTKSILKQHKDRILNNMKLYIPMLDRKILTKSTSVKEAKLYIAALMPQCENKFWSLNFMEFMKWLLDLIPAEEKYEFMKTIFNEHYPGTQFETLQIFYRLEYYQYMTVEQRESWALRQLLNPDKTIMGTGDEDSDYLWYKYVNFDKALVEIKKYLLITPDGFKRMNMVKVLIESARDQRDLEKLFNYYYEQHVNESKTNKESFIYDVLQRHNIFNVDESCWTAFNKLLYSVEVYNPAVDNSNSKNQTFYLAAVLYHIIHNYVLPDTLEKYFNSKISVYDFQSDINKLDTKKREIVYKYFLKSYVNKIKSFDGDEYNEEAKKDIRCYVDFIKELNKYFGKSAEIDIDVVQKYMKLDPEYFYPKKPETVTQQKLMRLLKQDSKLFIEQLPLVKETLSIQQLRLNTLLKIIKTYFSNDSKDIAQECLKFYLQLLTDEKIHYSKCAAVYAVFQLAEEKFKIEFLEKYAPSNPKIDHAGIDRTHLYIQEAICGVVGYSRPPMPLSKVLVYIKGDYVKYCEPMFNMYLMKLPMPACLQFVESLLDAPVYVQKHILRLAFRCFSSDNLKKIILQVWKRSKNISLRAVIYKYLFDDILRKSEANQAELFEVLLCLILDFHQDDNFEVIDSITYDVFDSELPQKFKGRYLESCWKTVSAFPHVINNSMRKVAVIGDIESNIEVMDKNFIKGILDKYFNDILVNKKIIPVNYQPDSDLNDAKFQLALTYIARSDYDNYLKVGLEFAEFITERCLAMWNEAYRNTEPYELYYSRAYIHEFINGLLNQQFSVDYFSHGTNNRIFNAILVKMQNSLPMHEMYMIVWKLRLAIIANTVLDEFRIQMKDIELSKTDLIKVLANYATEVSVLVKEFVDNQKFYMAFLDEIGEQIKANIEKFRTYATQKRLFVGMADEPCVFASSELANNKMAECVLLAIKILPDRFPHNSYNELQKLFKSVSALENDEIQSLLFQKLTKCGFKKAIE